MKTKLYPTPHINACPEDFAETVLMPGDPLRSKFIAENYLTSAKLVNNVRGVQGYTGEYKGKKVSVMASGMGMPSIGIYSYELYKFFGVKNIIRVGSIGSMHMDVNIRDIVFAMGACTNSSFAMQYGLTGTFAPIADFDMLTTAVSVCKEKGSIYHAGNVLSSDTFYDDDATSNQKWIKLGVIGVEMEAAALYMNAARCGKSALAMCTVSDHLLKNQAITASERQISFTEMIEIALETAVRLS